MDMPKIPYDSLYKFMTIVGLCLVIISFIPLYMAFEIENTWIEVSAYTDVVDNYFSLRLFVLEDYRTHNDSILIRHGIDPSELYPEDEFVEALSMALDSVILEETIPKIQTNLDDSLYQVFMLRYMQLAETIRWWGIGLSAIGLICWFFREQRYRDKILRNESKTDLKDNLTKKS